MAISWIQPSFAGGEIGPSLYGRIDMAKYQVHCASAITLSCGSMAALRIDLVRVLSVPPNTQIGNAA